MFSRSREPVQPVQPVEKRKKDIIPKHIREAVWAKYCGNNTTGICYCCGIAVVKNRKTDNKGWHCSHVLADSKGGEEIVNNLRICCPTCNLSMGDQNLYAYMRDHNKDGPGILNIDSYLEAHPNQALDKRSNNWKKKK